MDAIRALLQKIEDAAERPADEQRISLSRAEIAACRAELNSAEGKAAISTADHATNVRDHAWAMAMLKALGVGSPIKVPLTPTVDYLRKLFDDVRAAVPKRCSEVDELMIGKLIRALSRGDSNYTDLDMRWILDLRQRLAGGTTTKVGHATKEDGRSRKPFGWARIGFAIGEPLFVLGEHLGDAYKAEYVPLYTEAPDAHCLAGDQAMAAVSAAVDRFLGWPLPKTFGPDCGISFDGRKDDEWNKNKTWPVGTNLFTAEEARQMFVHCLSRMPIDETRARSHSTELVLRLDGAIKQLEHHRETHVQWRDCAQPHRDANPKIGDAEFHAGCVRDYDWMIGAIKEARARIKIAAPMACPTQSTGACKDRAQCWEPCGDLGKSEEHAQAAPDARHAVTVDRRDLYDFVRGAIKRALETGTTETDPPESHLWADASEITAECLKRLFGEGEYAGRKVDPVDVDQLAQHIRTVDGKHDLGAGRLAEAIVEWLKCSGKIEEASSSAALEWYGEQASALARYVIAIAEGNTNMTTAVMAAVTALALDAGNRAKTATKGVAA